jgi:tetratricopeptide (TPR) repeat protein
MRRLTLPLVFCTVLFYAVAAWADKAEDARALYEKGMDAIKAKDFKQAASLLEKAVELEPQVDVYVGNLAYVEGMLGRQESALKCSEKAIALNGEVPMYYTNAAVYAHNIGRHDKALRYSEKALLFGRDKLGEALHARMQKVREQSRAGPLVDRARSADKEERFEAAVALWSKLAEMLPNDAETLGSLALAEQRAGLFARSLANAEKAIALDGKASWLLSAAACAARDLGNVEKAKKYARQALTFSAPNLSPENARVMKQLLEDFQTRMYTIRWQLDPSKCWGEKGEGQGPFFFVPLPSTDRPYQKTTFTVIGARSHRVMLRDGEQVLRFATITNNPVALTAKVTVRYHDYRPLIKAKDPPLPVEVLAYLGPGPRIDPRKKKVKDLAAKLKGKTPTETINNTLLWLKKNIKYKNPSPFEQAEAVIDRGHGNCEGYSAVFVAVCRAAGIPARPPSSRRRDAWAGTPGPRFTCPALAGCPWSRRASAASAFSRWTTCACRIPRLTAANGPSPWVVPGRRCRKRS